jgi:signal transduction histidine kinase
LVLTRADAEALNLNREPLDLAELARVTIAQLAPQAEAKELALQLNATPAARLAWADHDRIAQVLVNLLDNAIKYSHQGSTVMVSVAPDASGRSVLVRVTDHGIGIPAEDLPHIGRRFYRADKARARARTRGRGAQSGSGLGLSIAAALIEAHGGRLWVESEESAGTTASFILPAE